MPNKYGSCACGGDLLPVWFTEEEQKLSGGLMIPTGRKRRACSHLTCSKCMKNECVDDSYDTPYR